MDEPEFKVEEEFEEHDRPFTTKRQGVSFDPSLNLGSYVKEIESQQKHLIS